MTPEPADFSEVERLVRARQWRRALQALNALVGLGADSARASLELGRVYAGMGERPAARRALARSLALDGTRASAHFELARLELSCGEPAAAADSARKALEREPTLAQARLVLTSALADLGHGEDAARELRPLLADPRGVSERELVDAVSRLAEIRADGALGPDLPEYTRGCAGDGSWVRPVCLLISDGRLKEGFALAESLLDRLIVRAAPQELLTLLWPWSPILPRSLGEAEFCESRLAALAGSEEPFAVYCRALLLICLRRREEAETARARLAALPQERYYWMRLPFLTMLLDRKEFSEARREAELILSRRADLWWARCRLAEALLAGGEREPALRELERAEAIAREARDEDSLREVLTWRGEILLWFGDDAAALAKLDEALALGASSFVRGWRGAALLRLGRPEEALDALAQATAADPKDYEARVWRAEALREAGRLEEAIEELDAVIGLQPQPMWALFNRALARLALGDDAGARADYARVPAEVRASLESEAGDGIADALRAGLARAKGLRREEEYLRAVWMPTSPSDAPARRR